MSETSKTHDRTKYDILSAVTALCLVVAVFLTVMQILVSWGSDWWFGREFDKYSVLENVRGELSKDEAVYVMSEITSYMINGDGNINVQYERDGQKVDFLSADAKTHIEDCRRIVIPLKAVRLFALVGFVLLAMWLKRRDNLMRRGLVYAVIALAVVGGLLATLLGSFDTAFVEFHELMFDNDLWLINPNVDDLINLLPQGFFNDTVQFVAVLSAAIWIGIFYAISGSYGK